MNQQLFDVARTGDITRIVPNFKYNPEMSKWTPFHKACHEDIARIVPNLPCNPQMSEWTPLHIACLVGEEPFARAFLEKNRGFLELVNPDGCTALHLASSNGHLEIVDLLLRFRLPCDNQPVNRERDNQTVNRELCLKKDKGGRNPLHHAVVKNRIQVMDRLLEACPESALDLTVQEETVFHLAVKNRASPSPQVLPVLLGGPYTSHLLNLADKKGNTVLHLAIVRKQIQIIKQLLRTRPILEVNAVNSSGLTPLDVLVVDPMCRKDKEIERMITTAGGIRLNESQEHRDDLKSITSGLFVMASLTAAASCQIAVFLQGGTFWSKDTFPRSNFTSISNSSTTAIQNPAGNTTLYLQFESEMKYLTYNLLVLMDTAAFLFSICLILLLLIPIPARCNSVKWLTSRLLTYANVLMFIGLYFMLLITNGDTKKIVYLSVLPILFIILVLTVIPIFGFFFTRLRPNGANESESSHVNVQMGRMSQEAHASASKWGK